MFLFAAKVSIQKKLSEFVNVDKYGWLFWLFVYLETVTETQAVAFGVESEFRSRLLLLNHRLVVNVHRLGNVARTLDYERNRSD